jgi:signal transduction histidine kinase
MSWLNISRIEMRGLSSAGLRLAAVQALVVVLAFVLAGYMAEVSLSRIIQQNVRTHILGEAASLDDEAVQKGVAHLPFTVAKRSRLWRGFEYRLADNHGAPLAGALSAPRLTQGWEELTGPAHAATGTTRYLAYTHRLSNGTVLTVAQDLAAEAGEMAAIRQALIGCGLLGVAVCLILSTLMARRTWRRIATVSAAANAVAHGRLDVRVPLASIGPGDDIDALARAFNGMLDRIEGLLDQVRQVSTDVAHDLRTPLNRFGQKLERLRRQVGGAPENLAAVQALERDLDEIVRTFDALLQLSEIETTESDGDTGLFDLAEIAGRVVEAYRPDIEASGRSIQFRGRAAFITADERLIAQSIANLLENAMRYTPPGSRITVETTASGAKASLIVSDNGHGVPQAERAHILKRFVRLPTNRSSPGSGLGLSIVAAVAKRHAGILTLEDAAPGLRVRIDFPGAPPASHNQPGAPLSIAAE